MSPKKVLKYRASSFPSKCLRLKAKVQKLLWSFPTSFLSNQITYCIKGPISEKPDDRDHSWNSTKGVWIVLSQGRLWNWSQEVHIHTNIWNPPRLLLFLDALHWSIKPHFPKDQEVAKLKKKKRKSTQKLTNVSYNTKNTPCKTKPRFLAYRRENVNIKKSATFPGEQR